MRAAVVGAGAWGSVVGSMLAGRCDTVIWAHERVVADAITDEHVNPMYLSGFDLDPSLRASDDLAAVVADRDLVVMGVPAQHVRGVAERLAPLVTADAVVMSLAKGIEQSTLLRPSQIVGAFLEDHDPDLIGVLSGPNLAREVMAGQPSATVVALRDVASAERVQAVLMSDHFRVYTSRDVVGCEIGGAVKNVIALAAGMADGLGYGWNARAALITRGLAELTRLGIALGGEALTFLGLAGNGDLIATCSSPLSRNRTVGVELGKGRALSDVLASMHTVAEGVASAPAILALADRVDVDLPIVQQVQAVLDGLRSPETAVQTLMRRGSTTELHDMPGL